jgi:hypothetical protein
VLDRAVSGKVGIHVALGGEFSHPPLRERYSSQGEVGFLHSHLPIVSVSFIGVYLVNNNTIIA